MCLLPRDCSAAIANSTCQEKVCTCIAGHEANSDLTACSRRRVNSTCTTAVDCIAAFNNSICLQGRCVCHGGHRPTDDGMGCVLRRLADMCTVDEECELAVPFSICNEEECQCLSGFRGNLTGTECIKRVIGELCWTDSDCYDAISHAVCHDQSCVCETGYDVINKNTTCVKRPRLLGERCHFQTQCSANVHPVSFCAADGTCRCPEGYYVTRNRTTCQPFPSYIGGRCEMGDHCRKLAHSTCTESHVCDCQPQFFPLDNATCQPYPLRLGEPCLTSHHCNSSMLQTECLQNNSCACVYGFEPQSENVCIERPIIPPFIIPHRPSRIRCTKENERRLCGVTSGQYCDVKQGEAVGSCRCAMGQKQRFGQLMCHAIQTYLVIINLTMEAGRYDYIPLHYLPEYNSSELPGFQTFADRVTIIGINALMVTSSISRRHVNSEVIAMFDLYPGVQVVALLHITAQYFSPLSLQDLLEHILHALVQSGGELGRSRLKLSNHTTKV
ncbi:multiple epidermal growth factor-like domains protein 6 isoform X2 [Pomacea canaliculata]|uniref:multiple epidermal growth factor-like domains protein 6 isoform X2 n=1 Tax=Pomacea canaliculata TaxID=400727 RepID=UPI000D726E38|nr:multiple epidermal growth factor-like domains protein 6 isoform X2 [Pomacea canaliculata]XP_025083345.1 multiple epidermal growth factor-like domains protein 6 isoform X2 [Pomacea canaliculata]